MGITIADENSKRNFSKYDVSGTDPNRYASVSNTKEADEYINTGKKSIIPATIKIYFLAFVSASSCIDLQFSHLGTPMDTLLNFTFRKTT